MTKEEIDEKLLDWNVDENAILFEPREDFDKGIIGVSENKCHLIYSYQKLTEALAKYYEKNKEADSQETYDDFLDEACEWVDYNTIRSIPYMNSEYAPIIIYEF